MCQGVILSVVGGRAGSEGSSCDAHWSQGDPSLPTRPPPTLRMTLAQVQAFSSHVQRSFACMQTLSSYVQTFSSQVQRSRSQVQTLSSHVQPFSSRVHPFSSRVQTFSEKVQWSFSQMQTLRSNVQMMRACKETLHAHDVCTISHDVCTFSEDVCTLSHDVCTFSEDVCTFSYDVCTLVRPSGSLPRQTKRGAEAPRRKNNLERRYASSPFSWSSWQSMQNGVQGTAWRRFSPMTLPQLEQTP